MISEDEYNNRDIKGLKNMKYKIFENDDWKILRSNVVNYDFNKKNGFMVTWGKNKEEDPQYSPFGNFILDIEVTTICKGPSGQPCNFCYKSNTPYGKNMSFEMFKDIIDRMPNCLTQIAFGADAQAESNPELFKMMEYSKNKGIIPNITVADITDETADKLVNLCGAVACSSYRGSKNKKILLRKKKK